MCVLVVPSANMPIPRICTRSSVRSCFVLAGGQVVCAFCWSTPGVLGQVLGASVETEADMPSAASFGCVLLHHASALPEVTGVLGVMRR